MIRQAPVKIIDLPIELILHLLFGTAGQRLVRNRITRIDIVIAQRMRQRTRIETRRRFNAFNPHFPFVIVFQSVGVIIDHVIDIVAIS
ncbi:hypothetical protein D3C73_1299480 [compost metagenome]